jgi:hypothetical protein
MVLATDAAYICVRYAPRPRGRESAMSCNRFVLAVGLLGLAGCATMSVEERTAFCTNTDWYRYGANDGQLGIPSSERADVISDCAELGRPIDAAAYQAGRAEGLREYCTVENGYQVGYSGRPYQQVCPPGLEQDFLQGFAKGRDDRPSYAVYPSIGIGIGSGGYGTGVGVGIGVGGYSHRCRYWDPFYCGPGWGWPWGNPWPYYGYAYPRRPYLGYPGHGKGYAKRGKGYSRGGKVYSRGGKVYSKGGHPGPRGGNRPRGNQR